MLHVNMKNVFKHKTKILCIFSVKKRKSDEVEVYIPKQNGYVHNHTEAEHVDKREVNVTLEMDNILDRDHPLL